MRYHVAALLLDPVGSIRESVLDEPMPPLDADVVAVAPVRGQVRLLRSGRGILASATLATRVRLACSRCLRDSEEEIAFSFDEEFRPTVDLATGLPLPTPDASEECSLIDEHHIIDLTDVVRQNALLALPMKPLCQESCPGLCPVCGERRDGTCRCAEAEEPARAESPMAEALRTWLASQGNR